VPRASGGIFLSYRRHDQHVAGRIADGLIMRFGPERVFLDVEAIEPGADFVSAITEAVGRCEVLVAVIGSEWASMVDRTGQRRRLDDPNDFVVLEIKTALERGIRVIPVLVDDAVMPGADELPVALRELSRRQAVEVEHTSFRADLDRILNTVERLLAPPPVAAPVRPVAAPSRPAAQPAPTDRTPRGGRRPVPAAPQPPDRSGDLVDGPTAAMDAVGPRPRGSAPMPTPTRTRRDVAGIPPYRTGIRVLLWWVVYVFTILIGTFTAYAVTRGGPGDTAVGLTMLAIVLAALFGVVTLLRREILAQRRMVESAGLDPGARRAALKPLAVNHIKIVTFIAVGLAIAFTIIFLGQPPAGPR
jgi:hypothetical protein